MELLKKFEMHKCTPAKTPVEVGLSLEKELEEGAINPIVYRQVVGSLRYIYNTRSDLNFSVGLINRYMQTSRHSHLNAAKSILHYLQGTHCFGIIFPKVNQRLH